MILFILFLVLQTINYSNCQNDLPLNFSLTPSALFISESFANGVELEIATGNEITKGLRRFEINFGYSSIIIGNEMKVNWGIKCDSTHTKERNSCEIIDENEKTSLYYSSMYKYQIGKLHFRIDPNSQLKGNDLPAAKVEMISSSEKWPLSNWGVLGLAPNCDFAQYIKNLYKSDFSILFDFQVRDSSHYIQETVFTLYSILNPEYLKEDVISTHKVLNQERFWVIPGELKMISEIWSIPSTEICLSSVSDRLISVSNPKERCEQIQKIVCKGEIGSNCRKENADLGLIPEMTIYFESIPYKIESSQYIYFEKDQLKCYFGDIFSNKGKDCPNECLLAVGKQFLSSFIPILHWKSDGSTEVSFLKKYNYESSMKLYISLAFFFLIVATITLFASSVFVMSVAKNMEEMKSGYFNLSFD